MRATPPSFPYRISLNEKEDTERVGKARMNGLPRGENLPPSVMFDRTEGPAMVQTHQDRRRKPPAAAARRHGREARLHDRRHDTASKASINIGRGPAGPTPARRPPRPQYSTTVVGYRVMGEYQASP